MEERLILMTTSNQDQNQVIRELYNKVQEKKREVAELSATPNWITNCVFKYVEGADIKDVVNIQTTKDIDTLVGIVVWLKNKERGWNEALSLLGLQEKEFKHLGFTVEQWITDIKTKVGKLRLTEKKAELERLEAKLQPILSDEFVKQLVLEELLQSDALK